MGNAVKGFITAVAIGALVGFTGGAALVALGFSTGGLISVGGVVLGGALKYAAIGAALAGLSSISQQFIKKPSMDLGDVLNRLNTSLDPNVPGMWVFGETAASTDVVYAENVQNQSGVQVFHIASHEIHEIGDLYANDERVFIGNDSAPQGGWAGAVFRVWSRGASSDPSLSGAGMGSWPSSAVGRGFAQIGLGWTFGVDKTESGIPSRITQVVKGAPVYDPRLDSTNGGSGSHRYDDQSTWEYTNSGNDIGSNWALVVLFYLLGWRENGKLVFGVGVDPEDIDWDQAVAAANVCDEIADGKPRYRVGGAFRTTQQHEQIIGQLEAAIGGKVANLGGKYFIWAPNDDLVSGMTITDADIVRDSGIQFSPSGPLEQLFNTAQGRYISPAELYQAKPYPNVDEPTVVAEDGRVRLLEHDFSIVQDTEIAERVARELVRRSRFSGTWRFAMGPKGLMLRPFSVVTINTRETDNEDVLARVTSLGFSPSGVVAVELLEEDPSIYGVSTNLLLSNGDLLELSSGDLLEINLPLGSPVTQFDPNAYDPSEPVPVTGLSVSQLTLVAGGGAIRDAFEVEWNDPGGRVRETEMQFRIDGDTLWQEVPTSRIDFTTAVISPLEPSTDYDVRARHITRDGVRGPWSQVAATSGAAFQLPDQSATTMETVDVTADVDINSSVDQLDRFPTVIDGPAAPATGKAVVRITCQLRCKTDVQSFGELRIRYRSGTSSTTSASGVKNMRHISAPASSEDPQSHTFEASFPIHDPSHTYHVADFRFVISKSSFGADEYEPYTILAAGTETSLILIRK